MSIYFENVSMAALQRGLDAVWLRQQVISNNIANDDTPGYRSKSVEFESLLQEVADVKYGNFHDFAKAVENINPKLQEDQNTGESENGNNVDLDKENIELARAQLQYDYLISSMTSQINRLRYAINGGN